MMVSWWIKNVLVQKTVKNITKDVFVLGDKLTHEMHLKQCRFSFSAFGPFTKNKARTKKL